MIKTLLLVALAISAHAAAPTAAGTCTGTFTQCAQCISSAMVASTSAEVCATCNAGFSLPATVACTGTGCTAYIANCATCATATPTVCATCASGYALDSTNSVCVSCTTATTGYTGGAGAGVLTCQVSSSKVVSALTCDGPNGYVLDTTNSVCVNCQTAKATAGTNTYGTALPGYQCTLNTANPPAIVASTAANPCVPKYALDKSTTATCVSCAVTVSSTYLASDANAASCSWTGTANSQTFVVGTCNSGYSPDTTSNACVSCSTGKSTSGTTYTSFVAGAAACTVTNTGTKISAISSCLSGYYFDSANSACISCATGKGTSSGGTAQTYTGFDANCALCGAGATGAIACLGCNSGTFLFYNGTCGNGTANDTNCQYFANQVHCVQCRTGLVTTTNTNCVACPANCNLCDTTGKVCSVCGTGYKLSTTATGTCVPNSANIIVPGLALLSAIFYFLF